MSRNTHCIQVFRSVHGHFSSSRQVAGAHAAFLIRDNSRLEHADLNTQKTFGNKNHCSARCADDRPIISLGKRRWHRETTRPEDTGHAVAEMPSWRTTHLSAESKIASWATCFSSCWLSEDYYDLTPARTHVCTLRGFAIIALMRRNTSAANRSAHLIRNTV